jgi:succinate dehydrogenase/fumarate reductase flavoprotein subunit
VLATGGFGGDADLRARHIDPLARDPPLRASPRSVGDGLRLGLSAGAARVLDEDGRPVPGLLPAGADSGGLWFRAYAGGVATALVFGLQAAETALTATASSSASPAMSRSIS